MAEFVVMRGSRGFLRHDYTRGYIAPLKAQYILLCSFMLLFLFSTWFLTPVWGQSYSVHGHLKYQTNYNNFKSDSIYAYLGPDDYFAHEVDARLLFKKDWKRFAFQVDAELLGEGGRGLEAREQAFELIGNDFSLLPEDNRRLFDLTAQPLNDSEFAMLSRLDRLFLSYATDTHFLRLGRQAISFGNGLVFHVMDFVNPFSPVAVDKDYKTGDDMLYYQHTFSSGNDLQFITIPRRDLDTHSIENSESSYALKFHGYSDCLNTDYDFMLARHYNENMLSLGFAKNVAGAVLRGDVLGTRVADGDSLFSFLVNIDRSWFVFEKNIYAYIEYFHSGAGHSDNLSYSKELSSRIQRGELYVTGEDYLALGLQIELEARVNLFLNQILNLHDESGVFQLRSNLDIMQDLVLLVGLNLPYGKKGSEFGGIEISGQDYVLASGYELYTRLGWYF